MSYCIYDISACAFYIGIAFLVVSITLEENSLFAMNVMIRFGLRLSVCVG